ncbi:MULTISPECIES: AAA family ATPase [unclassified Mycolicibacterium]|uniref:ATP-binding protein n=1 Tax=unclassified Mycolicibacterium TaxID=2636767 RepID=UPI002814C30C|nr:MULTISPECIES: adenylate/guanylate cyclase domain-containing protein [unclassified Mycolicibacterium]
MAREDARFCDACGSPIVPMLVSAEYKQVTVLFADVVRSMGIAAAVGAERLREIMADLVQRCAAVVQRYGGTVDKFTGDGVMALFGAPVALEDHAFRACLAALEIQQEAQRLAVEVGRHDGLTLQLRIGLNSGEVIAGDIGSGPLGYTAVGEEVGLAQRMESVAPAAGVMLSASTARLVEHTVVLDVPRLVRIKGADDPVPAWRLIGIAPHQQARIGRGEAKLVGRARELTALTGMLDQISGGPGGVVGVVGPPGIGKSRLVAETVAIAVSRGVRVFSTSCESHTVDVPFYALAQLMRTVFGIDGVSEDRAARELLRVRLPDSDAADMALLEDALGIRDPATACPAIGPDARRRRLIDLVNEATTARALPSLYVIEDAHWIDPISEAVLDGLLSAVTRAQSLVLITYRSDYRGRLADSPGSQTIALAPLDDEQTATLIADLLGRDSSLASLSGQIAERAAGNPFFAQEIVHDLVDSGALAGGRGCYICPDAADVAVPATLQAAIAARVDRLAQSAKRTLNAAAVIGARFDEDLLGSLADVDELPRLIDAEFIDQVVFTPSAEYAFRHPMIRSVVYHSQLKSTRAALHRRVAAAIEPCDENSPLIAEHREAGGELDEAFNWYMRAGNWLKFRNLHAAQLSWRRAARVADSLDGNEPRRPAMRLAPRALIAGNSFRSGGPMSETGFDELRGLAVEADDKRSLAIGTAGQIGALVLHSRYREAAALAAELVDLIDSIDDPDLTVALLHTTLSAKYAVGQMLDLIRLADRVMALADGDPRKGSIVTESPLLIAMMLRAIARACLGQLGWKRDLDAAMSLLRDVNPAARPVLLVYSYGVAILYGALRVDDSVVHDSAEVLKIAEQLGDDYALAAARCVRGTALVTFEADREYGFELLAMAREAILQERFMMPALVPIDIEFAKEQARKGDRDGAIDRLRVICNEQFGGGEWLDRGLTTVALVEQLLARGSEPDLDEATAATERLAAEPVEAGFVLFGVSILRMRAMLARARGDHIAHRDLVDRYRATANSLGFEGHMAWAEEMATAL